MKKIIPFLFCFGIGCATIGAEHVEMADVLLKNLDAQEAEFTAAMDALEDTSRKKLEVELKWVIGPAIIEAFMKRFGDTFQSKICSESGLNQSTELLQFTMAMSKKYEERKRKEWRPIAKILRDARRKGLRRFSSSRKGLSALRSGLKAYTKDKEWREGLMRDIGMPIDKANEINDAGKKIEERLEAIGK